jgi:hypothetical protein
MLFKTALFFLIIILLNACETLNIENNYIEKKGKIELNKELEEDIVSTINDLRQLSKPKNTIEGVWSRIPNPGKSFTLERNLSWGTKTIPRAIDIIIDLHSDIPEIEIYNFTKDKIISVVENGNIVQLAFEFKRGNFNVTMICHFNDDGTMWIEPLHDGLTFFGTGEDFVYYKIDGP